MTEMKECQMQVDSFLQEMERRTGLTGGQLDEVIREIVWLHRRRKRYEQWGDWFARSVISVFVAAFFTGAGWAIVQFIQSVSRVR